MYNTLWQPQTFCKLKGTNKQYDPNVIKTVDSSFMLRLRGTFCQHLSNFSVHQNKDRIVCISGLACT